MQRDLMEVKDEMRAVKDDTAVATNDVREEAVSLRTLWEQSSEKVNARTRELESSIDRQQVWCCLVSPVSSSFAVGRCLFFFVTSCAHVFVFFV